MSKHRFRDYENGYIRYLLKENGRGDYSKFEEWAFHMQIPAYWNVIDVKHKWMIHHSDSKHNAFRMTFIRWCNLMVDMYFQELALPNSKPRDDS